MDMTRRSFLGSSAAAVVAAGTMSNGRVFGANERIQIGVVGIRGRGGSHIRAFSELEGSEVVALCDVDKSVLEERAKQVEDATGKRPRTYGDMRDLMADDSIDAVTFGTPNHWHSLGSIWACQAGKDVYVEKPLSHNVWEGRQLAAAAKMHNRIVQHGTQRRSDPGWVRAMQRMREGVIGDIYMARGLCYKTRNSIGFGVPAAPPDHLDWDLWQGPAQERDYMARSDGSGLFVHYNWHWFWDYGNGDVGNQGVHQMDVAVWGMNKGLPVHVSAVGGRFGYRDDGQTPNTELCAFTYSDGTILAFEERGRATNDEGGVKVGNLFYGADGHMAEKKFYDKNGNEIPDEGGPSEPIQVNGNHFDTFLKAVRSRNQADIAGTAEEGHVSSAHCHLGNIAYRVGHDLEFDPMKERFVGHKSRSANKLLSRNYRKGFEVPKLV